MVLVVKITQRILIAESMMMATSILTKCVASVEEAAIDSNDTYMDPQ